MATVQSLAIALLVTIVIMVATIHSLHGAQENLVQLKPARFSKPWIKDKLSRLFRWGRGKSQTAAEIKDKKPPNYSFCVAALCGLWQHGEVQPWMAVIITPDKKRNLGVLIGPKLVLAPADGLENTEPNELLLYLGMTDLNDARILNYVSEFSLRVHLIKGNEREQHSSQKVAINLLILEKEVKQANVRPICLPQMGFRTPKVMSVSLERKEQQKLEELAVTLDTRTEAKERAYLVMVHPLVPNIIFNLVKGMAITTFEAESGSDNFHLVGVLGEFTTPPKGLQPQLSFLKVNTVDVRKWITDNADGNVICQRHTS